MLPPRMVWSEAPRLPSPERERTVMPRTTPRPFTIRWPSRVNVVVVIEASIWVLRSTRSMVRPDLPASPPLLAHQLPQRSLHLGPQLPHPGRLAQQQLDRAAQGPQQLGAIDRAHQRTAERIRDLGGQLVVAARVAGIEAEPQ